MTPESAALGIADQAQARAADPGASVFVSANAGSGKTHTLVSRVARLLLHGTSPQSVLCVTYTKAAAAEMQRRLFETLGGWSVMSDDALRAALAGIDEGDTKLAGARKLFARALETPGGLKIQTLHGFCEQLLHRFPLEAGVSPGFTVLDDASGAEVSRRARDRVALTALDSPEAPLGRAYSLMSVQLDYRAFEALFTEFAARRQAIAAYFAACAEAGSDESTDVWQVCGFEAPVDSGALEAEAMSACDWSRWRHAAEALRATGAKMDQALAGKLDDLARQAEGRAFSACLAVFSTQEGGKTQRLGTKAVDPAVCKWLQDEQERLHEVCKVATAARMAERTTAVLLLAKAYIELYEGEKASRGALDFADLVSRTMVLLTEKADAAWVLYKLDGGIDDVLVDEAQDTAPEQWDIVRSLTGEFFAGAGARPGPQRTLFVVGDEKQSIFGFMGARPKRLREETDFYRAQVSGSGAPFEAVPLLESWRSAPDILAFVDAVFADPSTHDAVPPSAGLEAVSHLARRADAYGGVDLWPLICDEPSAEPDPWDAPLDTPPPQGSRKRLARAIAEEIGAITAGTGVLDKQTRQLRPATPGDVLILVRRRDALFEEIIRALKTARIPVAGADRLRLSEHAGFQDLLALARFAQFPNDDLTLAELLRSPFCDLDEQSLFDLAHPRAEGETLWRALRRCGDQRTDWTDARIFLAWVLDQARSRTPFDFWATVLSRLDGSGRSMRQRLLTRLGASAEDALDECLAQALAAESRGVRDLESFVAAMERSDVEVKRELDAPRGEVRVMTVHGAKGLEAPIVILPDTTAKAPAFRGGLLPTERGGFLFSTRKSDDIEASTAAREILANQAEAEQLRLLYVALTRARDRLIVCGRLSAKTKLAQGSWYDRVEAAFGSGQIKPRVTEIKPARVEDDSWRVFSSPAKRGRGTTEGGGGGFSDTNVSSVAPEQPPSPSPEDRGWSPPPASQGETTRLGTIPGVPPASPLRLRFANPPPPAPDRAASEAPPAALPAWTESPAPREPAATAYVSPSQAAAAHRGPSPSPLSLRPAEGPAALGGFRRGNLIHRLLQILPDLPPGERSAGAEQLLAKERDLSPEQSAEMIAAAMTVLDDARFDAVFAQGSRAEVAIAGTAPELPPGLAISGRVDRMVVTPDRVLVVDFKTNRPSPSKVEAADPAYLTQMALYVAVLRAVFPGREVEAALVWTDGPKLMPVPEKLVRSSLSALGATS